MKISELVDWFRQNGYELTVFEADGKVKARFRHVKGPSPSSDELDPMVEQLLFNKEKIKQYLDALDASEGVWKAWEADRAPEHEADHMAAWAQAAVNIELPFVDPMTDEDLGAKGWTAWASLPQLLNGLWIV